MDAVAGLTFAQPQLSWLLLAIVPVAALLVWNERRRRRFAERFVSDRIRGEANPARVLRPWLASFALVCGILALAEPRLGYTLQPVPSSAASLAIVLDTSQSMTAADVGVSRLDAARAVVRRLLDRFDGKVGLVVFEGNAEVVSPLTDDHDAVATLAGSLGPGELSRAGSNIPAGIDRALRLLRDAGGVTSDIVLISDGEQRGGSEADEAIRQAIQEHARIFTVTIGTAAGATIPTASGPLQVDGEIVHTRADAAFMSKLAAATRGKSFLNPFRGPEIDALLRDVSGRSARETTREERLPVERYQIPLGLAMLFFGLASLANRGAE
ncbi:MAG: VWA domain-containing protein [Thermoanaerobaculia bacterium]